MGKVSPVNSRSDVAPVPLEKYGQRPVAPSGFEVLVITVVKPPVAVAESTAMGAVGL
jgi:hypothetical protein